MAKRDRNTLKSFFETGKRPTEGNFSDFIDSQFFLSGENTGSVRLQGDLTIESYLQVTGSNLNQFLARFSGYESSSVNIYNAASLGANLHLTDENNTTTHIFRSYGDSFINTGSFGIGTTSPTHKLTVQTSENLIATFSSTDNNARIQVADDDTEVYVIAQDSKLSLGFNDVLATGNLNIDSSGNVGIGITSPTSKLHVVGNINTDTLTAGHITASENILASGYVSSSFFYGDGRHLTNITASNLVTTITAVTASLATGSLFITGSVNYLSGSTPVLLGIESSGSLLPKEDGEVDLGSPTKYWKESFVSESHANKFIGTLDGQAATVATITGLAPDTATTQATQPNITSLGTLTGLNVNGNITASNISSSGRGIFNNLEITGTISGSNSNVVPNFIAYRVQGAEVILRNQSTGLILLSNQLSKTEIEGTEILLDAPVTASGNISASGILTAEGLVISDDANITDILTAGTITTSHITSSGNISASGNIINTGNVTSDGTGSFAGGIDLLDNQRLVLGTGNDLKIYHDGSHSYISEESGTGDLNIIADNFYVKKSNGDNYIYGVSSTGQVRLFYGNALKLATAEGGISITGDVTASGNISGSIIEGQEFISDGIITSTGLITATGGISTTNISASGHITASGNISASGNITTTQNITADGNLTITGSAVFGTNTVTINGTAGHITASGNVSASQILTSIIDSGNTNLGLTISVPVTASRSISSSGDIYATGNIGIGTHLPSAKLHVSGGSDNTLALFDTIDSRARIEIKDSDDSAFIGTELNKAFIGMFDGNSINNLVVSSSGRAGIGVKVTDPFKARLTVGGNLWASGSNGHITSSGNISSSGTIIGLSGSFTHLTNVNTVHITASGNVDVSGGDLIIRNITSSNVSASGEVIANDLTLSGRIFTESHITASGNISASGTVKSLSGSFDNVVIYNSDSTDPTPARLKVGRDNFEHLHFGMGDGTGEIATVQDELDGNHRLSLMVWSDTSNSKRISFQHANKTGSQESTFAEFYASGSLGNSGSRFDINVPTQFYDHVTASGVIISGSEIHTLTSKIFGNQIINGDITSSGNISASGNIIVTGTGSFGRLKVTRAGDEGVHVYADNNDSYIESIFNQLKIQTSRVQDNIFLNTSSSAGGPTTKMFISSSGNVGIGTITPGEKLEVLGSISASENIITEGHITASGHISASATSTGSFGRLEVLHGISSSGADSIIGYRLEAWGTGSGLNVINNATIGGDITSSGNISSSKTVIAKEIEIYGGKLELKTDYGDSAYARFYCESNNAHYTEIKAQPHALFSGNPVMLLPNYDLDFTKPSFTANVTASGDISASGTVFGISGSFSTINVTNFSNLLSDSHITSSGNISASGKITGLTGSFGRLEGLSPITIGSPVVFSGSVTMSNQISSSGTIFAEAAQFGSSTVNINGPSGNITASGNISASGTVTALTGSFSEINILGFGQITASGNISSSGTLISNTIEIKGGALDIKNTGAQSYARFYCESSNAHYAEIKAQPHALFSGNVTTLLPAYNFDFAAPYFQANVTASGNISASGTIIASNLSGTNTGDQDLSIYVQNSATSSFVQNSATSSFVTNSQTGSFLTNANTSSFNSLDISGSLTVTGSATFGTGTVTINGIAGHITASGNISASGNVEANTFKIANATILQGSNNVIIGSAGSTGTISLTTHTGTPFKIENDDNIIISGDISASGHIFTESHITASGDISSSADIIGKRLAINTSTHTRQVDIKGHTAISGGLYLNRVDGTSGATLEQPTNILSTLRLDSQRFRIWANETETFTVVSSSNFVGIKNSTPAAQLDVDGNINTTSHITASGNISASGVVIANQIGIGRAHSAAFPEYALDINGVSPVFRIATDNAVGGNNLKHAAAIWMGENGVSEARGAGLFYNGAANTLNIITSDNGTLTGNTPYSGSARITIKETDGNVGIGNITPTEKLTVEGNISASGNIITEGHITASGNISSSGDIIATTGSFEFVTGKSFVSSSTNSAAVNITMTEANYPGGSVIGLDMNTSTNDVQYTLPALTAGLRYTFLVNSNAGSGATLTLTSPSAGNLAGVAICDDGNEDILGTNFVIAAAKAFKGTKLEVVSDGTIYHLTAFCLCDVGDVSSS